MISLFTLINCSAKSSFFIKNTDGTGYNKNRMISDIGKLILNLNTNINLIWGY